MPLADRVSQVRKYLDADYWRLDTAQASYATRHGWSNEDVDIVPLERRTWRAYVCEEEEEDADR